MIYNIFDYEPIQEQENDYQKYMSDLPNSKEVDGETIAIDNTKYCDVTCCWAIPFQRITDNKWVYPKYTNSNQSFTEEEFSSSWIPSEE
jgi:hypothetical protein